MIPLWTGKRVTVSTINLFVGVFVTIFLVSCCFKIKYQSVI